jgi:hypothetical protein
MYVCKGHDVKSLVFTLTTARPVMSSIYIYINLSAPNELSEKSCIRSKYENDVSLPGPVSAIATMPESPTTSRGRAFPSHSRAV